MIKFRIRPFWPVAALLPVVASFAAETGSRWWSYVQFLASDKLEGRNTGSEGHRQAAQYVAAQFEKDGLKPAGTEGYIQPVKFITKDLDESHSSLVLEQGGKVRQLTLGEDAIIGTRINPAPSVDAEILFAGYGMRIPEKNIDDFAGLKAKGAIAVYIDGAPSNLSSALAAHYQSRGERWKMLREAGFVGAISIANPKHMDIPWPRIASNRFQMTMQLAAPGMNETEEEKIAIAWNPAHADELFGIPAKFSELLALVDAGKALPHYALGVRIKATTLVKHGEVTSQNIAAIYPGSDPKLKDEYVVMSAHVDHLGVGKPINGDSIFNGAMDNAAGTAALLDVAARLKESNAKTKRSILFVAVTGEEKGLLGSQYFAANPTVPAKNMVADINTDEFLPLFPLKLLTIYGLDESTLGDDIRAIAKQMNVTVQPDPEPARNVFIRSDQYNFVRRGIPSLMPAFGAVKGSPEAKMLADWNTNRYHAPSDDLSQPVDKGAAGQFNDLVTRLLERIANAGTKPSWKPESFFKRYAVN
jgi:Zn-dependent M28 family amino/carboxypeptidase